VSCLKVPSLELALFISMMSMSIVTLLQVLRPDIGKWVTLSPKYWAGEPSDMVGARLPTW